MAQGCSSGAYIEPAPVAGFLLKNMHAAKRTLLGHVHSKRAYQVHEVHDPTSWKISKSATSRWFAVVQPLARTEVTQKDDGDCRNAHVLHPGKQNHTRPGAES